MSTPVPVGPDRVTGLPPGVEVGPLPARFAAYVLDALPPAIVSVLVAVLLPTVSGTIQLVLPIVGAVLVLAWAVLLWAMLARRAATPGMRVLKLQLVGFLNGRPIGWGRVLVRALVLAGLSITGIGLLIMLVLLVLHPRRQGWHDLAADSVLIKQRLLAPPLAASSAAPAARPSAPPFTPPPSGPLPPPSAPPAVTGRPYAPSPASAQPLPQPAGAGSTPSPFAGPVQRVLPPPTPVRPATPVRSLPVARPLPPRPGGPLAPSFGVPPSTPAGVPLTPPTGMPLTPPLAVPSPPPESMPAVAPGEEPSPLVPAARGPLAAPTGLPTAPPPAAPLAPPPGLPLTAPGLSPAPLVPPPGVSPTAPAIIAPPPTAPPHPAAAAGTDVDDAPPPLYRTEPAVPPAAPPAPEPSDDESGQEEAPPVSADAGAEVNEGWFAVLDDGREIAVTDLLLLGRNPQPQPGEEDAELIKVADETRTVSKSHLAIGLDAVGLYVVDRGSTNGSTVTTPDGVSTRCRPGDPVYVEDGTIVSLGDHWLEIRHESGAA